MISISQHDECWATWLAEDDPWDRASQPQPSQRDKCWSTWLSEEDPQPQPSYLEVMPTSQDDECWSTWLADEDPWNQASQPQPSVAEQHFISQRTGEDEKCGANNILHQPRRANEYEKRLLEKIETPIKTLGVGTKLQISLRTFPKTGLACEAWMGDPNGIQVSIQASTMSVCSTPSMPPDSVSSQTFTPSMPPDSPTSESESEVESEAEASRKPRTTSELWYGKEVKWDPASNPFCL